MTGVLAACLIVGTPLAALAVFDLQNRLERWDHNRHAED
jgi:hypothetical protein